MCIERKNMNKSYLQKRLDSFKYACRGFKVLFKEQPNARIHLVLALVVIAGGISFKVSVGEWIVIFLLIGIVFSLEIVNSSIEKLCDYISPHYDKHIGTIKDLSAAAVLVAALISIIIGGIIFLPKIFAFIHNLYIV